MLKAWKASNITLTSPQVTNFLLQLLLKGIILNISNKKSNSILQTDLGIIAQSNMDVVSLGNFAKCLSNLSEFSLVRAIVENLDIAKNPKSFFFSFMNSSALLFTAYSQLLDYYISPLFSKLFFNESVSKSVFPIFYETIEKFSLKEHRIIVPMLRPLALAIHNLAEQISLFSLSNLTFPFHFCHFLVYYDVANSLMISPFLVIKYEIEELKELLPPRDLSTPITSSDFTVPQVNLSPASSKAIYQLLGENIQALFVILRRNPRFSKH